MVKKDRIKTCKRCLHDIDLDQQKYVVLGTYEKKKTLEESHYHWICFVEWYEGQVKLKAENIVKDMQQKAVGLFQDVIKQMGGIPSVQI
jgi:hypothetical protein